jgi:hypothetical protein
MCFGLMILSFIIFGFERKLYQYIIYVMSYFCVCVYMELFVLGVFIGL